jgi:hypothetical protein
MKKKKAPKKLAEDITRTDPFAAVIRKGADFKNTLVVASKMWYQHQLNKFKEGTKVTLEVHSRRPKRSDQQNRYYWGVYLPLIAKEKDEPNLMRLHELFKGMFLTEGVVEVLGKQVRMKKSTTDLGVGEFCQYVLDIEHFTEVQAPPTENYDLAPLHEGLSTAEEVDS